MPDQDVAVVRTQNLVSFVEELKSCLSVDKKILKLNQHPRVIEFFSSSHPILKYLERLSLEEEVIIKSLAVIGQARRILRFSPTKGNPSKRLKQLFKDLMPVEAFYSEIGGLVGYHCQVIHLLSKESKKTLPGESIYHAPQGVDISRENETVAEAALWGIEHLSELCEIYPVGGAADRLRLRDRKGNWLPAARLLFCGRTLLEGMIRDLQAREYLHFKLFRKQLTTPIVMMTSLEKDNHSQIRSICEENHWFGRPKNSFRLFCQPLVPSLTKAGEWCLTGPLRLLMKPGGHGVIWKLARDNGVFNWLLGQGRKKALVRQINNPVASCDLGILAFMGLGVKQNKAFGFSSCPRQVKAAEGINVVIEKKEEGAAEFVLTNIEYSDFKKYNIVDEPAEAGSIYSKFPSNTNILFVDLEAVNEMIDSNPFPGMLMNVKKTAVQKEGSNAIEEEVGRLESTMQNIADCFVSSSKDKLKSYLTYNVRRKTISCTKREFVLGSALLETPEGSFLDLLHNARELLVEKCRIQVPEMNDGALFFNEGPSFIFLYHPALGPLFSIIAQKLRGGKFSKGSEVQLQIADADIENLDVEGSLLIQAEDPIGQLSGKKHLIYSNQSGKCELKNVSIKNSGIDRDAPNVFWKNEIFRKQACSILIRGNGEFIAENVTFEGQWHIEVESGIRMIAHEIDGTIYFKKEPIRSPSWTWEYAFSDQKEIILNKIQK